jgi:hypothetical protein
MNPNREPAAYAELARLVITAVVALGWVTVDNATANTIASVIGTIVSIVLTVAVRQHVTPVTTRPPVE